MIFVRIAMTAALLSISSVAAAQTADGCDMDWPDDHSYQEYAARYFSGADAAAIDRLLACLADPNPEIRDEGAFTLWSMGLRSRSLSPALMRYANARLQATMVQPDDAAGFRRPFAALALSEIARADRVEAFLTDAERHGLARAAAAYLRGVTGYRGFTAGEGWRHGIAHGADLMLQLALNPRLTRSDADLLLGAIAAQVAPSAPVSYVHGEPGRLARPVLYLAKRADIDDVAWAAWFKALHPDGSSRWKNAYADEAGLAAVHNTTAFAQAVYVSAAETQDAQVKRLAPLALDLLKALP